MFRREPPRRPGDAMRKNRTCVAARAAAYQIDPSPTTAGALQSAIVATRWVRWFHTYERRDQPGADRRLGDPAAHKRQRRHPRPAQWHRPPRDPRPDEQHLGRTERSTMMSSCSWTSSVRLRRRLTGRCSPNSTWAAWATTVDFDPTDQSLGSQSATTTGPPRSWSGRPTPLRRRWRRRVIWFG